MEAYYAQNLAYGSLSDTNFTPSPNIHVVIFSTSPLIVQASDDQGRCPLGTYILDESSGRGIWS